jgi:hypothetical protein
MRPIQAVRPSWYRGQHRAATPWQQIWGAVAFIALIALCLTAIGVVVARPARAASSDYTPPMTAMFFYDQSFRHATDHYQPALSPYSSDNPTHVAAQVAGMRYAGMQAAIASWWGIGQHGETTRFPVLYRAAAAQGLGVIPYYEPEGQGDPSVAQIQADLGYLGAYATAYPVAAVRIGGKPVIFVYNAGASSCAEVTMEDRHAGFTTWYVNMIFSRIRVLPRSALKLASVRAGGGRERAPALQLQHQPRVLALPGRHAAAGPRPGPVGAERDPPAGRDSAVEAGHVMERVGRSHQRRALAVVAVRLWVWHLR